eukprot:scaffold17516_cov134-Isochrysis_galbana.AAC.1
MSSRTHASFRSATVKCILLAPSSVSLSINPSIHPELRAYCFCISSFQTVNCAAEEAMVCRRQWPHEPIHVPESGARRNDTLLASLGMLGVGHIATAHLIATRLLLVRIRVRDLSH